MSQDKITITELIHNLQRMLDDQLVNPDDEVLIESPIGHTLWPVVMLSADCLDTSGMVIVLKAGSEHCIIIDDVEDTRIVYNLDEEEPRK
jgi:hypothetical protein